VFCPLLCSSCGISWSGFWCHDINGRSYGGKHPDHFIYSFSIPYNFIDRPITRLQPSGRSEVILPLLARPETVQVIVNNETSPEKTSIRGHRIFHGLWFPHSQTSSFAVVYKDEVGISTHSRMSIPSSQSQIDRFYLSSNKYLTRTI